jgi:hypothetical protein
MSSVKDSTPDPDGQSDTLSHAKPEDDYWDRAEDILNRLREIHAVWPVIRAQGQDTATIRWCMHILRLCLEYDLVMQQFQQDPNIDPGLRAILRSVSKQRWEDGGRFEDPLPSKGTGDHAENANRVKTPPGDKMRKSLKRRAEADLGSDEETTEDRKIQRQRSAARVYRVLCSDMQKREEIKREQSVGAGDAAQSNRVLRSHSQKK